MRSTLYRLLLLVCMIGKCDHLCYVVLLIMLGSSP